MLDFTFLNPCEIVFGRGAEHNAGALVRKHGGTKVLLHFGGGSIKKSGLYDRVTASLKQEGLPYVELSGVRPNPRWSLVEEGSRLCRAERVDFILAVGGGSVIDSAKTIAAQTIHAGNAWEDFFLGDAPIDKALPLGTVLTIPAAGSEMSDSAVISNMDTALKLSCAGPALIPRFSLMNPELTYTLPPYQIACGASDILAHMMERYFTREPDVSVTDRLLEGAMKALVELAPRVLKTPEDYAVRAELMWVGTVAHNNFLGCGRQADWASHAMEHELSALYDIAHGAGLAIVFPAWMKYVHGAAPAKFTQFFTRVFDVDAAGLTDEQVFARGVAALETFYTVLGLPVRLAAAGVTDDRRAEMAKKACSSGGIGSFKRLDAGDAEAIYALMV